MKHSHNKASRIWTPTAFFLMMAAAPLQASTPVGAVKVSNAKMETVLDNLLNGKNITYKVVDKIVYLKVAEPQHKPQQHKADGEKKKISGRVVDETGEPLIGATITIKGTNERAVTDIDGNYTIMSDDSAPVLQFSYLGYDHKNISSDGNSVVNAKMTADQHALDEVVVTALGIKREKKMLGYSVQDIKGDALNSTGDASVTSALEGKVAGLQMNTASTGLGGSTKITIRGNSSLTDNNQPLWIVDGVPFSDDQISEASTYGGYDRGGTSLDINPEDIESVSVLKGPNAAALYGHQELSWLGQSIAYRDYGNKLKDYFNTGFSQFHTVALGNSTDKSHFRVSMGYNANDGLFKDESLDKLSVDLNAGTVINDYLSFDGKLSLSRMKADNRPNTGLRWMAVFPNGNEGWADFRRTDYPSLANQLTNNSGGSVPDGKMIKRILYPNSESSNQYFTDHAELQTANTEGTRLWWDVADTNSADGQRVQPDNFR